jgi:hypothetical protein
LEWGRSGNLKKGNAEAERISSEKFALTMVTASAQDVKDDMDLLDAKLVEMLRVKKKNITPKMAKVIVMNC